MNLELRMNDDLLVTICKEKQKQSYLVHRSFILVQSSLSIPLSEERVAIFATDYKKCSLGNKPAIFFVDRFRERFKSFSQQYIRRYLSKTLLADLAMTKDSEIDYMISLWIENHERMHEEGKLPLSDYLLEKSYRFSAAFEELRADIRSARLLLASNDPLQYKAGLLILAERTIGYPLFRNINDSDTISSVLFGRIIGFNFLKLIESRRCAQKFLEDVANELAKVESEVSSSLRSFPRLLDNYVKSMFQNNYLSYYNEYKNYWRKYENCNH